MKRGIIIIGLILISLVGFVIYDFKKMLVLNSMLLRYVV